MKKLILIVMIIIITSLMTGCATTKLVTDIGIIIGDTYQKSAEKGIISVEQSIKAWPYVSGQIKGVLAGDYGLDLSQMATNIINDLDYLASKDELTMEEKGFVIGSFVRLEFIAIEDGWEKYGISIISMVTKFAW